jgi:hypothetical protein
VTLTPETFTACGVGGTRIVADRLGCTARRHAAQVQAGRLDAAPARVFAFNDTEKLTA